MATVYMSVFFLLSYLVLLCSAKDENKGWRMELEKFNCGKLGKLPFPLFSNTRNPDCGSLFIKECNTSTPKIQLEGSKRSYEVLDISSPQVKQSKSIRMTDQLLPTTCESLTNLSFPSSTFFSLESITPNQTLYNCKRNLRPRRPERFKNLSCNNNDYDIWYGPPHDPRDFSKCSIIQLPIGDDDWLKLFEFVLEVHWSEFCVKCHHQRRGYCSLRNGSAHCVKGTIDKGVKRNYLEYTDFFTSKSLYIFCKLQSSQIYVLLLYFPFRATANPVQCRSFNFLISSLEHPIHELLLTVLNLLLTMLIRISNDAYSASRLSSFCKLTLVCCIFFTDKKERKWVIPILAVGWPVLLISCLGFTIWSYYKKKHASSNLLARAITYSKSDLEGGSVYFGVPLYSYNELQEATNNFDIEKELGDGGFGTVYYGKLRDGREVAVKRLYEHNYKRVQQFMNEVEILTRLHHTNLVSLYGCTSRHSRELLLVYEYIPNGTVADHIHGDRATPGSLTWPTRMSIAIETASALAYLHASDIIHRDVKTNNILLDNNFRVKVADFGLSRLFPTDVTHVSTAPQGTPGYVDPEYHQCYQLTSKSDVYSFGVVLMELISSQPAVDIGRHRHEINLANLAINKIEKCAFHDLIDPHLGFQSDDEVKRMTISVASLAFQCLQQDKELRPPMDEVLKALCNIQSCKDVPKDKEKAYEDAGMLNVEPQTSLDCDEVGLLKTKQLPRSPNSVTDNWTSRSTTPSCKDVPKDQDKAYEDAGMLKVDPQTSPDCDEIGLLKTKQLPRSPNSVTDNWTSRSTTPNGSN